MVSCILLIQDQSTSIPGTVRIYKMTFIGNQIRKIQMINYQITSMIFSNNLNIQNNLTMISSFFF